MNYPPNIILVGFMGSGKTTTGKELAGLVNYRFVDMDQTIEEKTGKEIKRIFQEEGEDYFRTQEHQLVNLIADTEGQVVSTGGGTWMNVENRKQLLKCGWCVWLKVSAAKALLRVGSHLHQRPLLASSKDPQKTIEDLLAERNPFYSTAHAAVETDNRKPKEVALDILKLLEENPPSNLRNIEEK